VASTAGSVLEQLSSRVHDRTAKSNLKAAARCLKEPALLDEIAQGLKEQDAALVGDCAEVLTEVAREKPELAARYATDLAPLVNHATTRVRWEAMHALALVATRDPRVIASLLPRLDQIIRLDGSVIARDYAVDAVGNYAGTNIQAARAAYPLLMDALTVYNGKQAGHALAGLAKAVAADPGLRDELGPVWERFADSARGVVRKAARALMKAIQANEESQ
jgi:carbon monoxide dehydrogenase subunit G